MNPIAWNKRKATIAITLCTIIAVSSIIFLQNNQTTQAALINPHPGLVGWWRFDEGTGTIAVDSSGNGNNGTISGATWVNGRYGEALSFNGATDGVQCGPLSITGSYAISAWIKADPTGNAGLVTILCNYLSPFQGMGLFLNNGKVALRLYYGTGFTEVVGMVDLRDGTWHFLVGVCNSTAVGANLTVYVDGAIAGTQATAFTSSPSSANTFIGQYGNGLWFKGVIDEVQVFNRVLSAPEIQADFQQNPDFSSYVVAKVPQATTQVIATLSWQGPGSINVTIATPSQTYTESMMSEYQKTVYSTSSGGPSSMLNIKRLSISVSALPSDQSWNITLTFDTVNAYQISVEVQK